MPIPEEWRNKPEDQNATDTKIATNFFITIRQSPIKKTWMMHQSRIELNFYHSQRKRLRHIDNEN